MKRPARRFRWWLTISVGLLPIVAILAWTLSRLTADPQGPLEIMFSRVQIGMSLDDAVAAVSDDADCMYISGKTRSGHLFDSLVVTPRDLPIAHEVQHGELAVEDSNGGEVDIILGQGGFVMGKRFNPENWGGLWLHRLHQVFAR
jgi:hypothetical protein